MRGDGVANFKRRHQNIKDPLVFTYDCMELNMHILLMLLLVMDGKNVPAFVSIFLADQLAIVFKRLSQQGSISTWRIFTTPFLAQFFPPGGTAKLRNDILMFQQHQGESISEAWTRFKDLLQNDVPITSTNRSLARLLLITHPRVMTKWEKEEGCKPNAAEYKDHKGTVEAEEEVEEENKEEFEEESEEETEEDPEYFDTFPIIEELRYHEWILKNPRPPWVIAKIRTRNMDNIKIECMVG
ncbi:zinc finger, CCHC-type containing protein [Tanacetum coccineum]